MTSEHLAIFAHGKESGPWGTKITHLAQIARRRGFEVVSPDYRHTPDPRARLRQLLEQAPRPRRARVLVGSSLGGWVSAMACERLRPNALFLMAPALYFPEFDDEPPAPPALTTVVHGWRDDIVPVERAIRYAQRHRATLHLLDSGHTLNDKLPELAHLFDALLERAALDAAYRAAVYSLELGGQRLNLQVDRFDAEADARLARDGGVRERWAIVSACNPRSQQLSAQDNAARRVALRNDLETAGLRAFASLARDADAQWPEEPGEWLCDPPPGYAEEIARRYGQNAIVCGRLGAAPELVWL